MKAWLVTWEWVGDHAKRADVIAALLNPRLSAKRVGDIVELLYANEYYSLGERMAYIPKKKKNPYPAVFGRVDGVQWRGQITCGHNPFLFARLVDDLRVAFDERGTEQATWKERPPPNLAWTRSDRAGDKRSEGG
jgi:hypothetical protein